MYLRQELGYLAYRLNQFKLSERIGILCCILLVPILTWDLFVRQMQGTASNNIEKKILQAKKKSKLFDNEKKRINAQLENPKTTQWLKDYQFLNNEIALYKQKVRHYKQKTLSEKKLVLMLNSIFKDIKPLKLMNFVSISEPDQTTKKIRSRNKPEKTIIKNNNGLMRKYYQLHLNGEFFAVMDYLKKIETLPWQLYWDEMYYKVDNYPMANLEITFHAMSKENK